jgi:hypothetical protein
MIRPQFSMRMLLSLTAVVGYFCYYWFVMPSSTAQQLVDAIGSENYEAADRLFWTSSDRTLADQKERLWGFRSRAELLRWTIGQLSSYAAATGCLPPFTGNS